MHQYEAMAANQMIIPAREVKTKENKVSAPGTTKQIWNKIALLHWDDLMDIGLHLSAIKELLPAVHSSDRQRVVSTNYLDNITPVAENVVFDDMKY